MDDATGRRLDREKIVAAGIDPTGVILAGNADAFGGADLDRVLTLEGGPRGAMPGKAIDFGLPCPDRPSAPEAVPVLVFEPFRVPVYALPVFDPTHIGQNHPGG